MTVLALGWALGGNVGVGTVLFAIPVGPLCNRTIPFFAIERPVMAVAMASSSEVAGVDSALKPAPVVEEAARHHATQRESNARPSV